MVGATRRSDAAGEGLLGADPDSQRCVSILDDTGADKHSYLSRDHPDQGSYFTGSHCPGIHSVRPPSFPVTINT